MDNAKEIKLELSEFGKLMSSLPMEQQIIIYSELNKYIVENSLLRTKLNTMEGAINCHP